MDEYQEEDVNIYIPFYLIINVIIAQQSVRPRRRTEHANIKLKQFDRWTREQNTRITTCLRTVKARNSSKCKQVLEGNYPS